MRVEAKVVTEPGFEPIRLEVTMTSQREYSMMASLLEYVKGTYGNQETVELATCMRDAIFVASELNRGKQVKRYG